MIASSGSTRDLGSVPSPTTTVLMLLTNSYDPDPRVRQEALALLEFGCRVRLLAWDRDLKSPLTECMEGVEVERVRLRSRHSRGESQLLFYFFLYLRLLWKGLFTHFDVVHCHDLDTLPIGFVLGKLKRKPIVYDAHELFVGMLDGRISPRVCRTLEKFEDFLLPRIDLLITVGEKLRRHFAARGARHAVVVGNWKELRDYQRTETQNAEVRRQLGVPAGAVLITCITQLLKNRMIEEMIDAVQPYADVYLLIAGKGVLEAMIRQRAEENPRVIFLGFIHATKVAEYTCASDVIYCGFDPVNLNEQFAAPNKMYEALAAGKPIITPDVGEIGEATKRTNVGVATPDCSPGALRQAVELVRDAGLRETWSRNARILGRTEANWSRGREVLFTEYSRFRPELGATRAAGPPEDSAVAQASGASSRGSDCTHGAAAL